MKIAQRLFHFLGGVHFAIGLIAIAIIMVIAGTILESQTNSHLLAAYWTYEHPFFLCLLIFFFINILFAALRRWPFKPNHFPFLLTHLGLLMIIGGTILKNKIGLQGQLLVWEGSGNHHLLIPHSHALLIEKKEDSPETKHLIAFDSFQPKSYSSPSLPQLKCELIGYSPHVTEELESWFKGDHAMISGFPPIPIKEWNPSIPFPESTSHRFPIANQTPSWSIIALRTSSLKEAIQQAYLHHLNLRIEAKNETRESIEFPLKERLNEKISLMGGSFQLELESLECHENSSPSLNLTWKKDLKKGENQQEEKWTVALSGEEALIVKPINHHWLSPPFTADLKRPEPLLCFIEDDQKNLLFLTFDQTGQMYSEKFISSSPRTITTYNRGFGGYYAEASLSPSLFSVNRETKELKEAQAFERQLRKVLGENPFLSPPLKKLQEVCEKRKLDFAQTLVTFLSEWKKQGKFLFNSQNSDHSSLLKEILNGLNQKSVNIQESRAIEWIVHLMDQLENEWKIGNDPIYTLKRDHWPLIGKLEKESSLLDPSLLNKIAQQIFFIAEHLPPLDHSTNLSGIEQRKIDQGEWLSAYLRAFGIDDRFLTSFRENQKDSFETALPFKTLSTSSSASTFKIEQLLFETPLTHRLIPTHSPLKLEERRPGIVLKLSEGNRHQTIALPYNLSHEGLKWPVLEGDYLVRFQPFLKELPYHIRLRQAREIFYPQSQQVFSYECDVLISEKGKGDLEKTLSMNQVYETWDGYRFYLSGIGHSPDRSLKRIQLAVNYDPGKYYLTYPGALFVFMGTCFLFWGKRRGRPK